MRTASSRFDPYRDHTLAARATLLPSGVQVPITSGSVQIDPNQMVRATGDFTVGDDGSLGWVPTDPEDPLAPYGNEVRVERGMAYDDGTSELLSIATLRIERASIADTPGQLEVRIQGLDRAQKISEALFEEPYQIDAGTNIIDAITDVLTTADPAIEIDLPITEFTVPKVFALEGDDPWEFCQTLAKAGGADLYFNADGIVVMRPLLANLNPVTSLDEEESLLSITLDWERAEAYNRVIVTGENSSLPTGSPAIPRGMATDEDEDSPTYYHAEGPGAFGKKPLFFASEYITSDAQADDVALAILQKNFGTTQAISFESLVDPRLEPGDVALVTRRRIGLVEETHILEELTFPLGAGEGMSGSTRLSRVTGT